MPDIFFQPFSNYTRKASFPQGTVGNRMVSVKETEPESFVLLSVGDAFSEVRKQLYSLADHFENTPMRDLGVFKSAKTKESNLAGLKEVLLQLHEKKAKVLILSTNSLVALAQWQLEKELNTLVDCALIAPSFSAPCMDYLQEIWKQKEEKKQLFHISLIGHQSYFNPRHLYKNLSDFFYDDLRLGEFRANTTVAEPLLREADFACFDVNAIKYTDFTAGTNPLPNGFYSEEACLVSRYAGISNRVKSLSFLEINPQNISPTDAQQIAQMAWYFIEGVENRYNDFPNPGSREFKVIHCPLENFPLPEIVFLQSLVSGRLWMQVPFGKKHRWTGCTEDEYLIASQGEIPEKWFRAVGIE